MVCAVQLLGGAVSSAKQPLEEPGGIDRVGPLVLHEVGLIVRRPVGDLQDRKEPLRHGGGRLDIIESRLLLE